MMEVDIDLVGMLTPIEGDNPAGEDLRYVLYDQISEARRADDALERGDWQREVKTADWEAVRDLCADALMKRTKDLQIAGWLTEALTVMHGFAGLTVGLMILRGFLENFWDTVYPEIDDGDLEFRVGRIEFLNNALWARVKQIPLTDSSAKAGYSWLKWEESRQVGYEGDGAKAEIRQELVAEGKLTAEEFDGALAASSRAFFESLAAEIEKCSEAFQNLEQLADEKFGNEAPRLAELRDSLEACKQLVTRILKEKRALEPDAEDKAGSENSAPAENASLTDIEPAPASVGGAADRRANVPNIPTELMAEAAAQEDQLWQRAGELLKASGIRAGLQQLQVVSSTASSVRQRNRYRLMMAKLCLKAERPDLAKPILEELHALIEELNLERWESPTWIADVLEALYQCLTAGDANDDPSRAAELFRRMCTLDITKAMIYKQ